MSYIPNCREDEFYNEKYLAAGDKQFIQGYDYALSIMLSLFDNMNIYREDMDVNGDDINLSRYFDNHPVASERFQECLIHWHDMMRNEIIVSFLDSMDELAYNANKEAIDAGKPSVF